MIDSLVSESDNTTIPLVAITKGGLEDWLSGGTTAARAWVAHHDFTAKPGSVLTIPGDAGRPELALVGTEDDEDLWSWGAASAGLPAGRYRVDPEPSAEMANRISLGWALGAYRFDRYKKSSDAVRELAWPDNADRTTVAAIAAGVCLTRDLVNTPASDMGPGELASAAAALAREYGGECTITVGDDLLRDNFPMVHAVGRASTRHPRLVDLTWGRPEDPKITLVGKGVCFDTGGLDLKPSNAMLLMKKDMGGAAQVLGLARMIMATGVRIRLRVLIPAVENSVSGDAFRPRDVLNSRKGLTVEIGNTDAEGRLVLADALTLAAEENPELIVDFATLTGAARIALGTELPALFASEDGIADSILTAGTTVADPVWRMPLFDAYEKMLESKVADLNNAPSSGFAGAITAALFLRRFVPEEIPWVHFDLMSWNVASKPGRPEGGEAQASRAVYEALRRRFGRADG